MTDSKKTADDTSASEEEVIEDDETKSEEETEEEESEEEEESKEEDKKVDYEAELAKEKERREKAEKAAADLAFKKREEKRKEKSSEETEKVSDEDKPLTASQLQEILAKDRQEQFKIFNEQKIQSLAKGLSGSDAETNLTVEIHKNRMWPSDMPLEQQLEEANAIANRKRLVAKNAELLRALKSKDTVSKDFVASYREPAVAEKEKISSVDAQSLKAAGMVWDPQRKVYKKLLGNKQHLYFDPKSKKRWKA